MLAPGTTVSRKVHMEASSSPASTGALSSVRANRGDERPSLSGDVLVIGAGDVAVDAAITAKRLGAAKVSMACLESRRNHARVPAQSGGRLREGIEFHCGFGPGVILQENGHVAGMELKRASGSSTNKGVSHLCSIENATMRIRPIILSLPSAKHPN